MTQIELFFLGPPRIERDNQFVKTDTRKAVALLAYLVLSGERHSRDALAGFLWPELDDKRARAALRRTLSTVRSAIDAENVYATRTEIGILTDHVWCDVHQFQQHAAEAEEEDLSQLEAAAELYRGDFLDGFTLRDSVAFDDWQLLQAQSLRREMESLLEILVSRLSREGKWEAALTYAHRWLALDPLREEVHRWLMQLYAWSGRQNAALRQYRECVRILEEELGVPPLAETTEVYQSVQEKRLAAPVSWRSSEAASETAESPAQRGSHLDLPLVGRRAELAAVKEYYEDVGPGDRMLVITGAAGMGKTRLARTFLQWAGDRGANVLTARCYQNESNLAYAPIIQALQDGLEQGGARERLQELPPHLLAEAARLLPEIIQRPSAPPALPSLDTPGARNRFFDGVARLFDRILDDSIPGVLWIDDVHWLDAASLDLLLFMARRWRHRPYLLLLCWRDEELPAGHALYRVTAELRRANVCRLIQLTRFTVDDVVELIDATTLSPAEDLVQKLYQETEGLPYFAVEYLHALIQNQESSELAGAWEIPRSVRDLLRSRLARVSETGQQLLQTAAAIGRTFDFDLLYSASGRSEEESVSTLEELLAKGILVERPGEGQHAVSFDFSHGKIQSLVYEEMNLVRRRLLHRRLAEALLHLPRRSASEMTRTGQIALHYQQAGDEAAAATYFKQAGDEARALFAHQEALNYYQSALACRYDPAWQLHEACGDLHTRLGAYVEALTSYETAASLAESSATGRLERKLGQVYSRQGEWGLAEAQFAQAKERLLDAGETTALSALYIDWSYVAYRQGQVDQAVQRAQQAQELTDTPLARAQTHNHLGLLSHHQGDLSGAIEHLQKSLQLAGEIGSAEVQIAALNNMALAQKNDGQAEAARSHLEKALELCRTIGDRHRQAALHSNMADVLHQVGEEDAAMAQLKAAAAIYAEIGGEPGQWQPEIWKLTEW